MSSCLFTNAKVFTGRSETEFASAFTVRDGKITWVGHVNDTGGAGDGQQPAADLQVDLQGKTVVPGFIDVHTHPTFLSQIVDAVPCTVPLVEDIPGLVAALRKHPKAGMGPNDWIEGWGYDESKLKEGRTPTRHDLDQVSTTQPVYVGRSDCHSGICNTRALQLAGIGRETPDPIGGHFGRDADGTPNGVLTELAANSVVQRAKAVQDYAQAVGSLARTSQRFSERGIVAVTDMMAFTQPFHHLDVYRDAAQAGFRQQAALYFSWEPCKGDLLAGLQAAQKEGRVKIAGIKLFADGSISGKTAWCSCAYKHTGSQTGSLFGMSLLTSAALEQAYEWSRANGAQMAVHAMGDAALQLVIDFFADKQPWLPGGIPSVRLEHATLLKPAQIAQMNAMPMQWGVATQIIFMFAEYDAYTENLVDSEFDQSYALKTFYQEIAHVALSSDAPATTWADPDNVFVSIQAAVQRRAYNGAPIVDSQALTVPQAVLLYTARAASLSPFEGQLGQIAPGFEASFAVLSDDIFSMPAADIGTLRVDATWVAGEQVYRVEQGL
ncbi:amidohydrolase [Comamonas testosteroni]